MVMAVSSEICGPEEILSFWFEELKPEHWFEPSEELDAQCERRFRLTHLALARDIGDLWHVSARSRLAAIILFDQMPRNMFRGSPLAFATDSLALREAKLAIAAGAEAHLSVDERAFLYLPFEHSENLIEQQRSVEMFTALGDANYLNFAIRHCEVIRQFGRFPHRNAVLGRVSTPAELDFLTQPGSRF
jgi:uncharacterized protein (DUF924 family)